MFQASGVTRKSMAFTERDIKDAHRDEVQDQKRKHRVRQKGLEIHAAMGCADRTD